MKDSVNEVIKHTADAAAGIVTIATIVQWLPPLAALFTIIWTSLRIYDWVEHRVKKRKKGE